LFKVWNNRTIWCFQFKKKKPRDFKFSKSSFKFLRIHIWLAPLLEYAVEQYLWSDSFIAASSLVSNKDVKLIRYQFWCTRCEFRLLNYLQWCSDRTKLKENKRPRGHIAHMSHIFHIITCKITFPYCGPNHSFTMILATWLCIR
jgi:hypothetical protein